MDTTRGQESLGFILEAGSCKMIQLLVEHSVQPICWEHGDQDKQDICFHGADILMGDMEHELSHFSHV